MSRLELKDSGTALTGCSMLQIGRSGAALVYEDVAAAGVSNAGKLDGPCQAVSSLTMQI